MSRFRVALSGDFLKPDGSAAFPDFDLSPLTGNEAISLEYVQAVDGVMPASGLAGFDALVLLQPTFTAASVPADGKLAMVARFGVGYDNVDLDVCNASAIAAVITPDGVRRPVAVSVMTYVLALAGKLLIKDKLCRQGPEGWARRGDHMGSGLMGKTLGQLGMGNVGAEVFTLAKPFGMQFIAHDPWVDPQLAADLGVRLVGIDEVFAEADYLSVSVPLNAATRGLVNAQRLALMKPTACVINTARGPVVDQRAIYEALTAGTIAGAALDVFETEPATADEPLFELDNVICTPHSLCWTDECFRLNGEADVKAVFDLMHGRVPNGIVNRAVIENPIWQQKLSDNKTRFGA